MRIIFNENSFYEYMNEENKEILMTFFAMNKILDNKMCFNNTVYYHRHTNLTTIVSKNIDVHIHDHIFRICFEINDDNKICSVRAVYKEDYNLINIKVKDDNDLNNALKVLVNTYLNIGSDNL